MEVARVNSHLIENITNYRSSSWGFCEKIFSLSLGTEKKIIAYSYPYVLLFDNKLNMEWKTKRKDHINSLRVHEDLSEKRILLDLGENFKGGSIHLLNIRGDVLWSKKMRDSISDIYAVDIDGDGKKEIIAGSNDNFVYAFGADGKVRWKYEHELKTLHDIDRNVHCVYGMDVDADGINEVVAGIGTSNGRVKILKEKKSFLGAKGVLLGEVYIEGNPEHISVVNKNGIFLVYSVYYEGNTSNDAFGKIFIFDSKSVRRNDWKNSYRFTGFISLSEQVIVGDIDCDGFNEIIFSTERGDIHVLDESGNLKWKKENNFRKDFPSIFSCGDINNDGFKEICVGKRERSSTEFLMFSHRGEYIDEFDVDENIHCFDIEDVDNDGIPEVICGGDDTIQLLKVSGLYTDETRMYDDDTRIY